MWVVDMKAHNIPAIVATLFIVILASCLFSHAANAKTVEMDMYVIQGEPYVFEFEVDRVGIIDAELMDFEGSAEELVLILESPSGKYRDVWWTESVTSLSLVYEVLEEDIEAGGIWRISVETGVDEEGFGVLKVTYPAEELQVEGIPEEELQAEEELSVPDEYEEDSEVWYNVLPWEILILVLLATFVAGGLLWSKKNHHPREKTAEDKTGSIEAISEPDHAWVYLDETPLPAGLTPHLISDVPAGTHELKFIKIEPAKCWYGKKEAFVIPDETAVVECEMKENEIKMRLSADPPAIPADGTSFSSIRIRIEDKHGIPLPVPEDITIDLEADTGKIQDFVLISRGHASTTAILGSSRLAKVATVNANCRGMIRGSTEVPFTEVDNEK
ncbi:MAG: hypothetical protein JW705_02835 [Methanosarcinaceae archaeon]|nr:hypothetical protein [Methanosarcinaceae archaeon]